MQTIVTDTNRVYLAPGEFADSDHPAIQTRAAELTAGLETDRDKARAIYDFVRDIPYQMGSRFEDLENYRASTTLRIGRGYCVAKACLFVALCRAVGLAARPAFADVTNHLTTSKLTASMGTDLFCWHGYAEVLISGHWLKVSPTFNASLCHKLSVGPLEFDGEHDAVLQAFDTAGRTFMSYDRLHGHFHDVPARFLAEEMPRLYPQAAADIAAGKFSRPMETDV